MRVLITGGAGFVGSHLADACLLRGDEVYVLDDLSTGSIDNIEYLKRHPYFHYTIGRVQNAQVTAELVDRVDVVYHLAAEVGVRRVIDSPISTIENNVQATEVVFSAAAKKGKRVLFTSTSEVYGLSADLPYREDGNIVMGAASKGRWSYACSKALDEFLALAYYHERQMPVTVVRLFNTVGPRQTGHYGMVVPTLVQQAMTGKPMTVYGDGSQSRCFGFVKDVVKALVALMERPEAAGEIYNIGASSEISILELAKRVKEITKSQSPIVLIPYADAYDAGYQDMPRRIPDTTKLRNLVGFAPTTDIDEIVDSVMRSFVARQERSAQRPPVSLRAPVRVA
ncbi:MAG TPA: GDP-mannose 4,6-dehydratase [Gemmatimonadaceae bacterium]|nr:GDP-mannose 4,6-dehydratase [Gemmatimonadaceae bacterium]